MMVIPSRPRFEMYRKRRKDGMSVFKLTVADVHKGSLFWTRSRYAGTCHVWAANEGRARDYASTDFFMAGDVATSPWLNPHMVECSRPRHYGPEKSEGLVELPSKSGMADFMAIGPNKGEVGPKR